MGLKFLDLFAGIGGFRLGMEKAGHKCIGYVEFDKFARKSYEAMYDTKGEWTTHDITTVTNDDIRELRNRGRVDVITGGFPCQTFSIAGKRKGFEDTRGTLFFEIARFANILQPRYLFLENVKGLLNHDNGNTFETILRTLDELGYDAEWDLLNSKDFGVPQNRERVFIIGHLRGERTRKVFPVERSYSKIIETSSIKFADYRYDEGLRIRKNGTVPCLKANNHKMGTDGMDLSNGVYAVLTPDRIEKRQNGRRLKDDGEPSFTLTAQDRHGVYDGFQIRKLTPKECWRLQGFPDELFEKAAKVNSNSQLYKQAGNSVTVNVIYEIAKKL
ncbi:MAG TPA: DNA cytosine methyltransferase [Atopostipes sp.]|nr:DNA cytosine methyltransferase [Atopostipes sp.]